MSIDTTGTYNSALLRNRASIADTSFHWSSLLPSTTYRYHVRAVNASGASYYSATITVATMATTPVGLAFSTITSSSITASWQVVPEATRYIIELSENPLFSTFKRRLSVTGASTVFTGLDPSKTYYARVQAFGAVGAASLYSAVVSGTTLAPGAFARVSPTAQPSKQEKADVSEVPSVYPNPSTGQFTALVPESWGTAELSLYDMQGKLVLKATAPAGMACKISIEKEPVGVYLLKITGGDQSFMMKIQKE